MYHSVCRKLYCILIIITNLLILVYLFKSYEGFSTDSFGV